MGLDGFSAEFYQTLKDSSLKEKKNKTKQVFPSSLRREYCFDSKTRQRHTKLTNLTDEHRHKTF